MKETRLYSIFERKTDGKWESLSDMSFKKSVAVRVFQSALIGGFMAGRCVELRPVRACDKLRISQS